jgi:hypothetical protein
MTCARPLSKIVWLTRARLETAVALDARLVASLKTDPTRPIYLLFREAAMRPQVIISKLRDIYGPSGVLFSVLSEKPGRLVICAWSCSETTKSESPPSSDGPGSTCAYQ